MERAEAKNDKPIEESKELLNATDLTKNGP
jgi:hypothetical protein